MTQRNVHALNEIFEGDYAVVDMDTGTVLNTNLRIVNMAILSAEEAEEVLSNDGYAHDFADNDGAPLFVEDEFLRR